MTMNPKLSKHKNSSNLIWEKLDDIIRSFSVCNKLFEQIELNNKSWAIVGGTIRVWITQMGNTTNDLDLVVNAGVTEIDDMIKNIFSQNKLLNIEKTKLGGYRVVTDDIQIDIWSANRTIGIVNGNYNDENMYRSISKSAALSLDSIVFTSRGTIYERGFFKTLKTGVLSLNHSKINQSQSIANKAIRLCNEYDLIPDLALQSLIISEMGLNQNDLLQVINAYNKRFVRTGSRLVSEFENISQPHKR
tara:strand:- start:8067 stop:8807 length:741 start_codon:yes stop_codon:yes gene_type:complete